MCCAAVHRQKTINACRQSDAERTSSVKDTARFTTTMPTSVTRQSWGTHTICGAAERTVNATPCTLNITRDLHRRYAALPILTVSAVQTFIQLIHQSVTAEFTSRKLSMAGKGCSMMRRRKEYRLMQDSKNGPEEIKDSLNQMRVKEGIRASTGFMSVC